MSVTAELICLASSFSRRNILLGHASILVDTVHLTGLICLHQSNSTTVPYVYLELILFVGLPHKLFKHWFNPNDIQKFGSYFTANTLHLRYKDRNANSVREIIAVYRENHPKQVNTLRGKKSSRLQHRSENRTIHYTKNALLSKILHITNSELGLEQDKSTVNTRKQNFDSKTATSPKISPSYCGAHWANI